MTASPGISQAGESGAHLKLKYDLTLSGCTKPGDPAFPTAPKKVATKTVNLPAENVNGKKMVGIAGDFVSQLEQAQTQEKVSWGKGIRPTTATMRFVVLLPPDPCVSSGPTDSRCEVAFVLRSTTSSTGPLTETFFLDDVSTAMLKDTMTKGSLPMKSAGFDPKTSGSTEGVAILTTGSVGGANVAVGDDLTAPIGQMGGSLYGCPGGTFDAFVTSNDSAPGSAVVTVTMTAANCTSGFGFQTTQNGTVSFPGQPFVAGVSDVSLDQVSVPTASIDYTIPGAAQNPVCTFTGSLNGDFLNASNSVSLSSTGADPCPGGGVQNDNGTITIPVGPLTDTSVSGSPLVYVN